MHEMAIVTEVVDAVLEHATKEQAERVVSVELVVGQLHDVVDDLMESCFRYLARGTVAENASLVLTKVPVKVQCEDCLLVYPADLRRKETLVCPDCGSTCFQIITGNEFLINGIAIQ